MLGKPTPVLKFLFSVNPTLAARCYLDANPENVDHDVIKRCWTQDIEQGERVKMVQGIQTALKDPREVVDFIDAVFRTAETDTEVLYHCDVVLARIDTAEATRVRNTMFDHWHKDRAFNPADFENDDYWKFADIDTGEFQMGSNEHGSEKPIHPVKLSAFRLGCYAVTVEQYHRFDPGHRKNRLDDEFGENECQPVVRVSWYDAYIFCKWAGCRLPTEAEWEYACRAGSTTPFNTGDNLTTEQANYHGNHPYKNYPKGKYVGKTTAVGSYPPNDWGLFDMHGNVWEWCRDWYDETYYEECKKQGVAENPQGPATGSSRLLRGGSWYYNAYCCRSAYRYWNDPVDWYILNGFRVIQDSPH